MVKDISEIEAKTRDRMVCPACFTRGLQSKEPHASELNGKKEALFKASACTNDDCKYHPSNDGPITIPSRKIKEQYGTEARSFSFFFALFSAFTRRSVVIAAALLFASLVLFGLPYDASGGESSVEASPAPLDESSSSFSLNETIGNWSIYESEGNYLVSGRVGNEIMYLNAAGELVDSPFIFDSYDAAETAILGWRARDDQLEDNSQPDPVDDKQPDPLNQTGIGLYEHNGTYVISGVDDDGNIIYIDGSGNTSDEPVFFTTRENATNVFLDFLSNNPNSLGFTQPDNEDIESNLISYLRSINSDSGNQSDNNTTDTADDSTELPSGVFPDDEDLENGDYNWGYDPDDVTTYTDGDDKWSTDGDGDGDPSNGTGGDSSDDTNSGSGDSSNDSTDGSTDSDTTDSGSGDSSNDSTDGGTDSDTTDSGSGDNSNDSTDSSGSGDTTDGGTDNGTTDSGSGDSSNDSTDNTTDGSTNDGTNGDSNSGNQTSTGSSSYDVQGTVKDSDGNAAEGATVHLHSNPRTTTTNSQGEYSFSDITPGEHELYVEPSTEGAPATAPVEFTMTESGQMKVDKSQKSAVYLESEDGTVSGNAINFLAPPGQDIELYGNGTDISGNLTLKQSRNADSLSVELTGIQGGETTYSPEVFGGQFSKVLAINTPTEPSNQSLRLSASPVINSKTTKQTLNADTGSLAFDGNLPPQDVSLELKGHRNVIGTYMTGKSVTNGESSSPVPLPSVDDPGNLPLEDVQLFIAPQKVVEFESSASQTAQYTVWTCFLEDPECSDKNHTGPFSDSTDSADESGAYQLSYDIRGTAGNTYTAQGRTVERSGTVTATIERCPANGDCTEVKSMSESGVEEDLRDTGSMSVNIERGTNYKLTIEIQGRGFITGDITLKRVKETPQVSVSGGGVDKTLHTSEVDSVNPSPNYETEGDFSLNSHTQRIGNGSRENYEPVAYETVDGNKEYVYPDGDWTSDYGYTVSIDKIDNLSDIKIDTHGGVVAYRAVYTSVYGTKGVSADAAGERLCSLNVLTSSQTCDVPNQQALELAQSDENIVVGVEEGTLDVTADYTSRTAPTTAAVQINNKRFLYPNGFNATGPLQPRETVVADLNDLQVGNNTVVATTPELDGGRPVLKTELVYDSVRTSTTKPTIIVENRKGRFAKELPSRYMSNGVLKGSAELQLPDEWFVKGENRIQVGTSDGSLVQVKVSGTGLEAQTEEMN